MMPLCRFLCLPALTLLLPCCAGSDPYEIKPLPEVPTDVAMATSAWPTQMVVDHSAKRIKDRKHLDLGNGLVIYADKISRPDSAGSAKLAFRVYFDGTQSTQLVAPGTPAPWPTHAYAKQAEWNAATQQLILRGQPIVETETPMGKTIIEAVTTETEFTLTAGEFKASGPTKSTVTQTTSLF